MKISLIVQIPCLVSEVQKWGGIWVKGMAECLQLQQDWLLHFHVFCRKKAASSHHLMHIEIVGMSSLLIL